jgi:predicted metal-dependent enzyme (double-stranded beta helix superfamily)
MFDLENFITECDARIGKTNNHKAVIDILSKAVEDPVGIFNRLGEPTKGGIQKLYQSDKFSILNVIWTPNMTIMPHNHNMWAAIGVYSGREDNIFWRRLDNKEHGKIEAAGAKSLQKFDTVPLGSDIIHSVINPTNKFTCALHVYGGDFFDTPKSEWEPETLVESEYKVEHSHKIFDEANKRAQITSK